MVITSSDSQYIALHRQWQHEGGTEFLYQAALWRAIEDNGEIKFVRVSSNDAFQFYASETGRNVNGAK